MLIGVVAGFASTFGFAVIQSRLQKAMRIVDTCGVSNLHGIPGILGGIAAVFVVTDVNINAQFIGIGVTAGVALISSLITGKIISLFGNRDKPYEGSLEF